MKMNQKSPSPTQSAVERRVKPAKQAALALLTGRCFDRVNLRGRIPDCNFGKFRKSQIAQKLDGEKLSGSAPMKLQNWQSI